jgi:outer membrane protein insertion porin family
LYVIFTFKFFKKIYNYDKNLIQYFMKRLFLIFCLCFFCFSLNAKQISDIQVEGLQRLDAGLVFNSIPFEINDDIDSINLSETIKLLYQTGQFKDVVIERKGSVVIISLKEKPLLYELNFRGATVFQPEALSQALSQMNISSGLVIDEADIFLAANEIRQQYNTVGKYNATVTPEIIPLSKNRINVTFFIDEGGISRINEIKFFGNKIFSKEVLLDELNLKVTNYLSWWNKDDRYSKQILSGDLESIKSFYMDKGYLDFKITSARVSISKNKKNVYISISMDEGKKYIFGDTSVTGNLPEKIDNNQIISKITFKAGDTFSRKAVNQVSKNISNLLGNYGYAFANVNAIPNVDKDNLIVSFNFNIDQGKKIYVRRINIVGNDSSKDEVIRRELRQYEGSWFSQEKIDLSKTRLNRTQFFESVNIETPTVPGTSDQVDVNILLKETNTGKFQIGAGVSSSDGLVGTFSLSQLNFLGTGNRVSTEISTGGVNKVWSLSYVNPYWTDDGISRGFDVYYRDVDTEKLKTGDYKSKSYGFGINFGIPLDEFQILSAGTTFDFTKLNLDSSSPQGYRDFCSDISGSGSLDCDSNSLLFYLSWKENSVDNVFFPTTGSRYSVSADVTTPGLDLEYFKIKASADKFFSLSDSVVTKIKGAIGYADSYGDSIYPFFKNFKVGGKSTVRGYSEGSIGKKTFDSSSSSYVTYGGKKMISFGTETYFPVPFVKKAEGYRLSAFLEGGAAFEDSIEVDEFRYSAGLGAMWLSPFGPLSLSFAIPLNEGDNELVEKFQFGMGSSF